MFNRLDIRWEVVLGKCVFDRMYVWANEYLVEWTFRRMDDSSVKIKVSERALNLELLTVQK